MHQPQPTGLPPTSHRRSHWTRRRKVAITIVLLMILAPFAAAGIYVWNITEAIEEVQNQSVVLLPTSEIKLGGVNENLSEPGVSSPESADATTSSASETPAPTEVSTNGSSGPNKPSSLGIARDLIGTGTGTDKVSHSKAWPGMDHINILILGIDTRDEAGDQNADVIMIARVDFLTSEVRVVSIPRDLQVEIPEHGLSKINGAYNIGVQENPGNEVAGVAMMRDTIQYNFGIPIHEFVLIDFEGFEDVIDAVGGITIDVPERIEDDAYPTEDFGTTTLIIEAGKQEMDGETALAYSRTRHQDSDDNRRDRQMLVIRALLDKGQSLGSVTRITGIIQAAGDTILTSIGWNKQLALVDIALKLDQRNIQMTNITEPLVTPGSSDTGEWIYIGDPDEIGQFIEDVLSGKSDGN